MGKNKNHRRALKVDDFTDDDTLSTTSTGSSVDFGRGEVEEEQDEGTVLDGFIEALYEKRAATRENGLRGLIGALTSNVLSDFVDEKYETLLHLFLVSIKRGSAIERALAARAIGLLALTAGPGDIADLIMNDAWPQLVKSAKTDSSSATRVSTLDAMGIVPFVSDTELETTENAMAVLWQICSHKGNYHSDQVLGTNRPSGSVKAAAILSWALLLSTVPSTRIAGHYVALGLPTLSYLLKGDDLAVRKAAGEAVALLYETSKDLLEDSDLRLGEISDNPALAVPGPQPTHKLAASAGKGLEAKEVEVVERMKALSVQAGGKGQSKKERYAERASFKEYLTNIEDGVCREISLKLQGGDFLTINTWTHTIQLNALRRVLAEGFQRHLQGNELLHEIFQFQPRGQKRQTLSSKEKRLYMSPNSVISKARTQTRNRSRSLVQAGNEGHFNVNSDDA
ncbi:unnamed protein product [Calypogeia fissa]